MYGRSSKTGYYRRRLIAITAALVAIEPNLLSQADQGDNRSFIQAEVRPMKQLMATWLSIDNDRSVVVVNFSPNRLAVTDTRRGKLSQQAFRQLADRLANTELRQTFQRANYQGAGLSQGDQFKCWVTQAGNRSHAFGFLEDTPQLFQQFIGDLLRLKDGLPQVPPDPGYIRSEPVEPSRQIAMEKRGTQKFLQLKAMDAEQQIVVRRSIDRPYAFEPLSRELLATFLGLSSGSHQLFVTDPSGSYQLTLFEHT